MEKVITYNGKRYHLSKTNPKYYYGDFYTNGVRKKIGLHQKVFIDNNGPIPENHDVHHIDGNTFNNNSNNLEAISRSLHRSSHVKNRLSNTDFFNRNLKHLKSNLNKAAEWHKTEDGKLWHIENGKKSWDGREKVKIICKDCANEFESLRTDTKFCCNKCWQRFRRKMKSNKN